MEPQEVLNAILMAVLEERAVVDDPEWDTLTVLASVTPEATDMTAYRYTGSGPGRATPLRDVKLSGFRDLQAATAAPDGTRWEVCIIKVDRDSAKVAVNFAYADEAEAWRITPANHHEVVENLRPQPADFSD